MPNRRHVGATPGEGTQGGACPEPLWVEHLGKALNALYDPGVLRASPLIEAFDLVGRCDPVAELQRILIGAIDALGPAQGAPRATRAWRIHQILRRRYVEQLTQRQVSADLGLSRRQLQREEKAAREILAALLWNRHGLGARADRLGALSTQLRRESPARARAEELARLRASVQAQATDIGALIRDVLETVRPLLDTSGVSAVVTVKPGLPQVLVQAPMLRQALLNAISALVHGVPGGEIAVAAGMDGHWACITLDARCRAGAAPVTDEEFAECVEMAQALVQLLGGSVEARPARAEDTAVEIHLRLPHAEQLTVLVIDDNEDALRLIRRYLHGSRYHFAGTSDPQEGLRLAEQVAPRIVVLDVMMPDTDGWMLLGQLREHPATRGTPVIVCTILAQEELALALGAADYIRKPVSRAELLAALDRQVAALPPRRG